MEQLLQRPRRLGVFLFHLSFHPDGTSERFAPEALHALHVLNPY
jgi:hypothetical protein